MLTWVWRAATATKQTSKHLIASLSDRGFEPVTGKTRAKVALHITLYPDGAGGTLVTANGAGGLAIAQALSRAMKLDALYAEVDLKERDVTATLRAISSQGALGPAQDRNDAASELCSEWFEGKKYRPERAVDLAAMFVDLGDGCPAEGNILMFDRVPGRARVQGLIDAVRAGATWEKTTIGDRAAIRIKDAGGTRISALDEAELAEFERGIA